MFIHTFCAFWLTCPLAWSRIWKRPTHSVLQHKASAKHAAHRWPGVGRTWPFHQILPSSRIGWKWKGGCSIGSLGPTHCCAEWMTVTRCANVLTGLARHLGLRSVLSPMGRWLSGRPTNLDRWPAIHLPQSRKKTSGLHPFPCESCDPRQDVASMAGFDNAKVVSAVSVVSHLAAIAGWASNSSKPSLNGSWSRNMLP